MGRGKKRAGAGTLPRNLQAIQAVGSLVPDVPDETLKRMLELRRERGLGIEGEPSPGYIKLGRALSAAGVPSPQPGIWNSHGSIRNILRYADSVGAEDKLLREGAVPVEQGKAAAAKDDEVRPPAPLLAGLSDRDLGLILMARTRLQIPLSLSPLIHEDKRVNKLYHHLCICKEVRGLSDPAGNQWWPGSLRKLLYWADSEGAAETLAARGVIEPLPPALSSERRFSDSYLHRAVELRAQSWPLQAITSKLTEEGLLPLYGPNDDRAASDAVAEAARVFSADEMVQKATQVSRSRFLKDVGYRSARGLKQSEEAVARIRELAAQGLTGSEIAEALNDEALNNEGLRTRKGQPWRANGIYDVCSSHAIERQERPPQPLSRRSRSFILAHYDKTPSLDALVAELNRKGLPSRSGRPWALSSLYRELDELDLERRGRSTPEQAVARLVELKLAGHSLQQIADILASEGFETAYKARWQLYTVRSVIVGLLKDESLPADVRRGLEARRHDLSGSGRQAPSNVSPAAAARIVSLREQAEEPSFQAIADQLNAEGVPTPSGVIWRAVAVYRVYTHSKKKAARS